MLAEKEVRDLATTHGMHLDYFPDAVLKCEIWFPVLDSFGEKDWDSRDAETLQDAQAFIIRTALRMEGILLGEGS